MPTLADLKQKYGLEGGKYEPNPACKFCHGAGEKKIKSGRRKGELTFCVCLFVDHSASDEIGTMLSDFAKRKLDEMRQ